MKTNKLWVAQTNSLALALAECHPHAYANADHCLYIATECPYGAVEVTDALIPYLTESDWAWIYAESDKIRQEQEEQYHEEIQRAQEEFLARFEADLKSAIAEGENGEPEKDEHTGAGSAEN